MWPILFKIPLFGLFGFEFLPIRGYGVLVALGFLVGSWIVTRNAKREGEDPTKALDLVFYILLAAIIGSRLMHVLVSEQELFFKNPLHLFKIWEGGLVFYGGFIASSLVALWFFQRHQLNGWQYFDFFTPAIALGHAIGRLGCFLAGCCYGKPLLASTWYSITFPPNPDSSAPTGIPLYPTQLMESFIEFLLFLVLSWILRRKSFHGQVTCFYLMFYACFRFLIEFLRGDFERGFFLDTFLSTSQLVAIILFAIGLFLYLYKSKPSRKAPG